MKAESPPAGLRSLEIESRYRSDSRLVVQEFYIPLLTRATSYRRAVGYFTGRSMALLAEGIDCIATKGGRIEIVASPHLETDDVEEIQRGYDRRKVIERALLREISLEIDDHLLDGLSVVGSLIARGQLDIKLAFIDDSQSIGIYHEKFGVVRDDNGDIVAFTGSSNETIGGLVNNFESIEVYRGWLPGDGARALRLEADFNLLWENRTPKLSVTSFPDVAVERMVEVARTRGVTSLGQRTPVVVEPDNSRASLAVPSGLEPRPYQLDAMTAWLKQGGRGILKMATGTGKTKTALFAATQIAKVERSKERPLVLLVVAPLQALVDQWIDDVQDFGARPIAIYENSNTWLPKVEAQLAAARLGQRSIVTLVATNASFAGKRFQAIIRRLTVPLMIIADEVHNFGASSLRSLLPDAAYRLGLSATPERWLDNDGTNNLIDYFGPVVFELDIEDAITKLDALCPYYYRPRIVELTSFENERYSELTAKIGIAIAAGESVDRTDSDSRLGKLLRDRAAVLGHASNKVRALREDVRSHRHDWFQLIYCAEGRPPVEPDEGNSPRQIDDVMRLLGNDLNIHAHPYTSETPRKIRRELLERFRTGSDLRALVAMRCLDEGVDIPDARIGYLLASSSNPRQFIQRRGRLLRKAPGKEHAEIIDYIAVPPSGASVNFSVERNLLIRELRRVNEFAKISKNYSDTLNALRPLKLKYQLMDI